MNLRHYTEVPFVFNPSYTYEQDPHNFKPRGLWLSDDDDHGWKAWCEDHNFHNEWLQHATDFELRTDANVLLIEDADDLHAFTRKFTKRDGHLIVIDWKQVARRYDGIVITPYQWTCRLDPGMMWYYSWDCASGCVWNLSAVAQRVMA